MNHLENRLIELGGVRAGTADGEIRRIYFIAPKYKTAYYDTKKTEIVIVSDGSKIPVSSLEDIENRLYELSR